ncbi:Ig-like domain-containing protein, partial [Verminephrobacter aporrectodeae]
MDTDSNTTPGATADTVRPSATVTLADSILSIGKPTTTVTFAFSERVTGFTADDIDLKNAKGTLSPLIAVDDRTWTATFTSTINIDGGGHNGGTDTISVDLSGVTDAANHTGQGLAVSAPYDVDTKRPTLLSFRISNDTGPDPTLHPGESASVSFIFSEALRDFKAEDVKVPNGNVTVSGLYRNLSVRGSVWEAALTASMDSPTLTHIRPTVNLAHVTDFAGNAGEGTEVSTRNVYGVDPESPELFDATVTANQLVLTYIDENSLDKDHPAPKEAFTVHVDEGINVVTNVAVDPKAKTVTLTLTSPVTAGQKVILDYADPTGLNDANAIQDVTGNDALSVKDRWVSNGTPDTPPPTTSLPPTP